MELGNPADQMAAAKSREDVPAGYSFACRVERKHTILAVYADRADADAFADAWNGEHLTGQCYVETVR